MPDPSPELLRRLYSTPPERFVAVRDEAVAAARTAGDRAAARQLAALRRPTVAAWLVNLLALYRPELIADLVWLAGELRAAQRDLRGARLRELSAQRRAVVGALVAEARELATGPDPAPPAGRLPLAEVEATLNAALADRAVAEEIRSGRLLRAVSYAGFGEVPRPQLRLVTGGVDQRGDKAVDGRGSGSDKAVDGRGSGSDKAVDGEDRGGVDRRSERADRRSADRRPEQPERPDHTGPGVADRRAEQPERPDHAGPGVADRQAKRTERTERAARAEEAKRAEQRRLLVRELTRARAGQQRAEGELAKAVTAERDGRDELAEIELALAEWERRRAATEQTVARRKLARQAAEQALRAARRRSGEIEAAMEAAQTREGAAGTTD